MNNRFIIIIGSRNNSQWVESNLGSVLSQDYPHYKAVYFDDASDDDTGKKAEAMVKEDPRFSVYRAMHRQYKTWFFANIAFNQGIDLRDNDILVFLDGDDMFASENVLSYLNEIYNQTECWMTYGGMRVWKGGEEIVEPFPQNSEIPPQIKAARAFRQDMWRYSHLKTMRGFLWKKFNTSDLMPEGIHQACQDDLAIMFAMLEMCPDERVYRVTEPLYIYNGSPENGGSRGCTELKTKSHLETIIRSIPPYKMVPFVTPLLAGGLGNQMFEIAAAASLAKDNNAVLIVNNEEHILPNQGRNINNYTSNIFSKILFGKKLPIQNVYKRDLCTYEPIPYSPNMKTMGHFQSYKYFDHNRDYIKNLFSTKEYYLPMESELTAIQVRRGDYWKFPDHHPQLTPDYYHRAVEMINPKEIVIYSDDIPWCQENLKFNVLTTYKIKEVDWEGMIEMSYYKNLIISNSSFGWWAAYLNPRMDKRIFAPSTWFGRAMIAEGFNIDDLILPDWTKVNI